MIQASVHEWLRARLLRAAGVADFEPIHDLDDIRERNWHPRFIELMRNRTAMGFYRYGHIHNPQGPRYDNVGSAIRRLEAYLATGNLEHLVDAANLCLCEFTVAPNGRGSHPSPTWAPVDDGDHTSEIKKENPSCP